ncbi:MAG: exopolysaccharide biosynthesis protein [Cellvibrionaceae bacterium]|nr:exopolysaccharide biosynthesis protein [Cellvibrionaceae bacterium]
MTEQSTQAASALSQQLEKLIEELPEDSMTVSELIDRCGEGGLLLLAALLTLVFLIPVSLPGVSTLFGAIILLVGISRLRRGALWLPEKFKQKPVTVEKLRPALQQGLKWVHRLEKVSKSNRLSALADGAGLNMLNNLAFILAALLLMAPFGFVPFSNTFPGIALLFYAIGLAQRDGVAILLGHLMNIATILYFSILIGGGGLALKNLLS